MEEFSGLLSIGLCKAALNYDSDKTKFSTFAYRCMGNEVSNYLRKVNAGKYLRHDEVYSMEALNENENRAIEEAFLMTSSENIEGDYMFKARFQKEYDKLKDAPYIEPWLYQTCMHRFTTALKTYRRRMKHHLVIDEKMENVLSSERTITTIDALLDKESNLELLNRVFDAFTDREWSIAQDYFVSEMTAEEVANRNQTSIGAIKAIVFRMRTKAKKIAKENPNFLLIAPYLLILLGASKK